MDDRSGDFSNSEASGAMSLERAISAVRRRVKLVVGVPIIITTLTAALVVSMPDRYDASAIVQIDPRQKLISNLDTVVSDLKGDNVTVESEVEIIRSRPVILSVIDTLNLRSDPDFARISTFQRLLSKFGLSTKNSSSLATRPLTPVRDQISEILDPQVPGATLPERDEVAVAFAERMKVVRVRTTLLIDIRFTASNATKAALIANTIAETYLKQQIESKRRANAAATELLESKIGQMRASVSEAEKKVEQWKAQNNVLESEGQILSEKELARSMEQTVNARNSTAEARAKYENAERLAKMGDGGNAIAEVLNSPTIRLLKDQLANANRKAAELSTRYGPKHPEFIKSRAEVAQATSQLNDEMDRQVSNLKGEFEIAEARERQLRQNLTQMQNDQIGTKDQSFELKALEREAATSKQLLEAFLSRFKQTSGVQDFQLPDAHIVERADTPLYPSAPKRKQLVLLSLIIGIIFGTGLAVLLDLIAPGISRPEDIERVFQIAHISSLPTFSRAGVHAAAPSKMVRFVVAEPASQYADAIRSARRQLDILKSNPGPRIVLVTSSVPGEGADVVASNLAHYYAMTGARPILVDCDMRLQPLTKQLAPQRQRGLMEQVVSARPVEHAVLRDGLTGLHFLPAAAASQVATPVPEVLGSQTMARALDSLKTKFDTIILSAPPLFPILDARILADHADQIVVVMTWQKTPKQLVKKALRSLGPNESKVAGLILNSVADEVFNESLDLSPYWGLGRAA